MSNLKFGVVGCGGQGGGWAKDLAQWEGVDLVGLCDINMGRLKQLQKVTKCEFLTTNYEELLDQDLDAVVIATPHYLHAPYAVMAAEREINVFSEKPMAITVKQCNDMIKAAKQNDIKLALGFQRRFGENERKIKKALDAKLIGDIIHVNCFARWYRHEVYYVTSTPVKEEDGGKHWRGIWSTEGGSALINQTVHLIDLFQWFGGQVKDIQASAHIGLHEFIETEDNVGAVVNFQNGSIGLIQAGVVYPNCSDEIAIYGTKGKIVYAADKLEIDAPNYDEKLLELEKPIGKRPVMQNFIDAINDDVPISVDGVEGRKTIELIRGIYMSIMNNGKVSFPVADNGTFPSLANIYNPDYE